MFDTKAALLRLRVVGLTTNQADQILKLVLKWASSEGSGEAWTVDRLKSIKVDLLRHYAGLPPVKNHSWIRYRNGCPKGPFRVLFQMPKKRFRTAWNAIMVYTGFVFVDPEVKCTKKQWDAMVAAIQRPPLPTDDLNWGLGLVHESPFFVPVHVEQETGSPLMDYQPSPSRRAPKGYRTVPEVEGVYDSTRCLIQRSVWTSENWDILDGSLAGVDKPIRSIVELNMIDEIKTGSITKERPLMGVIALIQEGGYKLRFAANPYRIYQQALQPLGRALFRALRRIPNDFTFDQQAAIPAIQSWLAEGRPACSMDLSNCSDNLPLDLQLELLSRLGVKTRWLQFFRDCCRGDWYVVPGRDAPPVVLRWTVGSPLGLYPTFASFALLHHSIAQWCFSKLGRPKAVMQTPDGEVTCYPYVIVGDDFTVMDNDVALLYRDTMRRLGVPISEHKTLWSQDTAEFIGRVITSKDVTQGFKWKGRMSDDNFVDFCRNFGPRALTLLSPRQKRVISFIADLPEPYGLGWNPFGIPLEERLTPSIERCWSRDERKRTFNRRAERVHRLLYMSEDGRGPLPSGVPLEDYGLDPATLSSDQEDLDLTKLLIPGLESWGVAIWPNLPEIVAARGLPEDLRTTYAMICLLHV